MRKKKLVRNIIPFPYYRRSKAFSKMALDLSPKYEKLQDQFDKIEDQMVDQIVNIVKEGIFRKEDIIDGKDGIHQHFLDHHNQRIKKIKKKLKIK